VQTSKDGTETPASTLCAPGASSRLLYYFFLLLERRALRFAVAFLMGAVLTSVAEVGRKWASPGQRSARLYSVDNSEVTCPCAKPKAAPDPRSCL